MHTISILGSTIGLGAAYYAPMLRRILTCRLTRRRLSRSRTLVLTYDDGPCPTMTLRLLALLGDYGAHATFFMLASRAEQHPVIVRQVIQAGHEVGCHSRSHLNAWRVSPGRAAADIDEGYHVLDPWLSRTRLYRPPFGKMTAFTYRAVRRNRGAVAWWTIDSGDTWRRVPSAAETVAAVRRSGGGVVLMHDLDRTPERNQYVLEATELLLAYARSTGMRVATFGQVAGTDKTVPGRNRL